MIELFFTEAERVHGKLNELLYTRLGENFKILRTEKGKPYIEGNPLYFSVSHSGTRGVIALSERPVGVDLEVLRGRERTALLNRFSQREKDEISSEKDFLLHWTAREAYVKLFGLDIASYWRRIEFYDKKIYLNGEETGVGYSAYMLYYGCVFIAGV